MYNFNWNYDPNDYHANHSDILAEGDYKVSINSAITTVARNGTEGLEITFDVNGHNKNLKYYIWLNTNNVQRTNQNLGQFFSSFDIGPSEQNSCEPWVGKQGAVHVIHSEYKGRTISKVAFCIDRDKQDRHLECHDERTDDKEEGYIAPPTPAMLFPSLEEFNF